jgi:hypothetical protein
MKLSTLNHCPKIGLMCLCLFTCIPIFSRNPCVAAIVPDTNPPKVNELQLPPIGIITPDTNPPKVSELQKT